MLTEFDSYGDKLRYHKDCRDNSHGVRKGMGPVVVWNCTNKCNLSCKHCYSSSGKEYNQVLSTEEGINLIKNLASFNIPVLLLSGGEPLLRDDIFYLIKKARENDIRVVISSNGTLLDKNTVKKLKELEVSYLGISIDGKEKINDKFRGDKGAYKRALEGIRTCKKFSLKVGLRFTINKFNYQQIDDMFKLIQKEDIPRICFYHLVYSGRGKNLKNSDLVSSRKRVVMEKIIEWTQKFIDKNDPREILTVDNHADGVYLYLKMLKNDPEKARIVYKRLVLSGGNRSGIAIANIDAKGRVHPDQFSQDFNLGNVKEKSFSEIWTDKSNDLLNKLRNRKQYLKGKCKQCKFLDLCNGNLRARAYGETGDFWASDPGCYLKEEKVIK